MGLHFYVSSGGRIPDKAAPLQGLGHLISPWPVPWSTFPCLEGSYASGLASTLPTVVSIGHPSSRASPRRTGVPSGSLPKQTQASLGLSGAQAYTEGCQPPVRTSQGRPAWCSSRPRYGSWGPLLGPYWGMGPRSVPPDQSYRIEHAVLVANRRAYI
jgi:hypothetical protein